MRHGAAMWKAKIQLDGMIEIISIIIIVNFKKKYFQIFFNLKSSFLIFFIENWPPTLFYALSQRWLSSRKIAPTLTRNCLPQTVLLNAQRLIWSHTLKAWCRKGNVRFGWTKQRIENEKNLMIIKIYSYFCFKDILRPVCQQLPECAKHMFTLQAPYDEQVILFI